MTYSFPAEFDPVIYRKLHSDLKKFNDRDLRHHFNTHGRREGRVSNKIASRTDFIDMLPKDVSILEIGPFYNPVVTGENVKYFDVIGTEDLIARAASLGMSTKNVPRINFVDPVGDLGTVNERFDIIVSSHSIEHQPDLVSHLQKVEQLLVPGGVYFALIPDKRYIFDHFIAETTIAEVVSKHLEKITTHSLKSVIEHRALTTHNFPPRHWAGDHGAQYEHIAARTQAAIDEYNAANGGYIDVHASYFTPDSFNILAAALVELDFIKLKVTRTYHTRRDQNEFFVIMAKEA